MKRVLRLSTLLLVIRLLIPFSDLPAQTTDKKGDATNTATKPGAIRKHRPSGQEIADAKAKGLVWVNTATRVYHKDGPSYGTTKRGKFVTEDEAKKAGFRMASEAGGRKTPDR